MTDIHRQQRFRQFRDSCFWSQTHYALRYLWGCIWYYLWNHFGYSTKSILIELKHSYLKFLFSISYHFWFLNNYKAEIFLLIKFLMMLDRPSAKLTNIISASIWWICCMIHPSSILNLGALDSIGCRRIGVLIIVWFDYYISTMVTFVCAHCDVTLKKKQVEKHVYGRCRPSAFICIDCHVTFRGNDYINHISCLT